VLATLQPEVRFDPADSDLYFLHRGEGERDIYFLANTSGQPKRVRSSFRDAKGKARLWDAMDGSVRDAGSGARLDLELEPYGSALVIFDPDAGPAPRRPATRDSGEPVVVNGPWTLTFGTAKARIDRLDSWTRISERRYYSGRGDYTMEVEVPRGPRHWRLELGEVREIAEIKVNGTPAGVCWKLPYSLDVTKSIKPGRNTIQVGVTNLLINRILGEPAPDYSALKPLRFPEPAEKKMIAEPLPSGLLGPVRLVPFEVIP